MSAGAGSRDLAGEGAPSLRSPKGPVPLPPCSPGSRPFPPLRSVPGRDVGIELETGSAAPPCPCPGGHLCICCGPALLSGQRSRVGCGGAGGGMRGTERALTAPPHPQFTAAPRSGKAAGVGSAGPGEIPPTPPQGTVLQFFTRLRRHASLDGASPYFRIKKWKLESTQRASSLDTRGGGQWGPHGAVQGGWTCVGGGWRCRLGLSPQPCPAPPPGSPKRRQFQRQRAASESMDQEDRDPHQTDIIQYIAHTDDVAFHPAGGPFLPSPASPPPSLGRYFSVDKRGRGWVSRAPGSHRGTPRCPGHGELPPLRLWWGNRVWGEGSGGGW